MNPKINYVSFATKTYNSWNGYFSNIKAKKTLKELDFTKGVSQWSYTFEAYKGISRDEILAQVKYIYLKNNYQSDFIDISLNKEEDKYWVNVSIANPEWKKITQEVRKKILRI